MVGTCPLPSPSGKFRIRHCIQWDGECDSARIQEKLTHYEQLFRDGHTQSLLLLPTAREGNVFTGVCLSTIGLMDTSSLLGLVTVRSYWNTSLYFFIHVREICQQQHTRLFISSLFILLLFSTPKTFVDNTPLGGDITNTLSISNHEQWRKWTTKINWF